MADEGDTPICFGEYSLTYPDVVFLSDVPDGTIRNWQYRGVLQIGRKVTGRWRFSMLDALKLRVMSALCIQMPFSPLPVVRIADKVVELALQGAERNEQGELRNQEDGLRPNINLRVAFSDSGEMMFDIRDSKDASRSYPPLFLDRPLAQPYLIIPVTSMVHDMLYRHEELVRLNAEAERAE